MQRTEKVLEINAPIERVFDLFSDFESFPRWMRNIKEVRYTGHRYTRWTADAPLHSSVEWEAEITGFEPDRYISWRSVRGDVYTEGEVVFRESGRGRTRMRVRLGYDPPAGRLGSLIARLFGTDPEQQLAEDLERFAAVAEGVRPGRRLRHEDDPRPRFEQRHRADYVREVERGGSFRQRRGGGPADERRLYESRMRDEHHRRRGYEAEREAQRPARYALTPRERELEMERRRRRRSDRYDQDYSRQAFSRGVDKLMDDAPSSRWRRH